jgi:hypothetical protein
MSGDLLWTYEWIEWCHKKANFASDSQTVSKFPNKEHETQLHMGTGALAQSRHSFHSVRDVGFQGGGEGDSYLCDGSSQFQACTASQPGDQSPRFSSHSSLFYAAFMTSPNYLTTTSQLLYRVFGTRCAPGSLSWPRRLCVRVCSRCLQPSASDR